MAAVGLPYPALLLFAAQLMLLAMSSAHLARMQAALCAKNFGKFGQRSGAWLLRSSRATPGVHAVEAAM